jgi:hypothetical protein
MTVPDRACVTSSFAQGFKQCVIPLRGEKDGPAEYTVRLYFPPPTEPASGKMTLDIKLQGNVVAQGIKPAQRVEGTDPVAPLEFTGIRVDRNLEIELNGSDTAMPVMSGLEVLCTGTKIGQMARR